MRKILLLVILALGHVISDRVYESECPEVTSMQDFDMTRVSLIVEIFKRYVQKLMFDLK